MWPCHAPSDTHAIDKVEGALIFYDWKSRISSLLILKGERMTEHHQRKFITRILFFAVLCIAGSLRLAASEMAAATYTLNQLSPTTWNYQFTVTDTGTTPI